MASKRCHFREIWLQEPEFAPWLQQEDNDSKGYCKLCTKSFDLSNTGIAAVKSHMKSKQYNQIKKHKQSPSTQLITNFLVEPAVLFLPLLTLMSQAHLLHRQFILNKPATHWLFHHQAELC